MTFLTEAEADLTVYEVLDEMDSEEKKEMFEILCEELERSHSEGEEHNPISFGYLTPSEQKRFLCDALCVPYHSNDILIEKLKPIINAL